MPRHHYIWHITTCCLIAALAPCLGAGCVEKQDIDRLRSEISTLRSGMTSDVQEIKKKYERLMEFEKLKVRRELKVAAMTNIAEALAASRAWEIEAKAFYEHSKANKDRNGLMASERQSPDKARIVGPYEGDQPYTGSFSQTYARTLPSAKVEVFKLLDDVDRDKVSEICDQLEKEMQSGARGVETYQKMIERVLGERPGVESWWSQLKPLRDYRIDDEPIWWGPSARDLRDFKTD